MAVSSFLLLKTSTIAFLGVSFSSFQRIWEFVSSLQRHECDLCMCNLLREDTLKIWVPLHVGLRALSLWPWKWEHWDMRSVAGGSLRPVSLVSLGLPSWRWWGWFLGAFDFRWQKGCNGSTQGACQGRTGRYATRKGSGEYEEFHQGAGCCWFLRRLRYGKVEGHYHHLASLHLDLRKVSTNSRNRNENYFSVLKEVHFTEL